MRHAVRWVTLVAFAVGVALLFVVSQTSDDPAAVFESASTDLAVAFMEIAITIGVVDLLLKSYSERQHRQSVTPRIDELILHLRALSAILNKYLSAPSLADLERYRRVAVDVQQAAFGLYILMANSHAVFASELLNLSHKMRDHLESIEDSMASFRNASTDLDKSVHHLREVGAGLFQSGSLLTDQLVAQYPTGSVALGP